MNSKTDENQVGFPMDDETVDPMLTGEYTKKDEFVRLLNEILTERNPLKLKYGASYEREAQEIVNRVLDGSSNEQAWRSAFGFGLKLPATVNHQINLLKSGRKNEVMSALREAV